VHKIFGYVHMCTTIFRSCAYGHTGGEHKKSLPVRLFCAESTNFDDLAHILVDVQNAHEYLDIAHEHWEIHFCAHKLTINLKISRRRIS